MIISPILSFSFHPPSIRYSILCVHVTGAVSRHRKSRLFGDWTRLVYPRHLQAGHANNTREACACMQTAELGHLPKPFLMEVRYHFSLLITNLHTPLESMRICCTSPIDVRPYLFRVSFHARCPLSAIDRQGNSGQHE